MCGVFSIVRSFLYFLFIYGVYIVSDHSDNRQERMPLYEALCAYTAEHNIPFHMPGHMQGQGAAPELRELMGAPALAADITQVLDMDDIHRPVSYTREAQALAAEYFGAKRTWFLVNGSTCGNQAMLMACTAPGDEVVVPRCAHRSLQAGLVFSGARPCYVSSPYSPEAGVCLTPEPEEFVRVHKAHPAARAWALLSATTYGACADVASISRAAHDFGVPVLADEAWGPHFGAAPGLPRTAVSQGADCVVQSAHKLLGALSQASMLHWNSEIVDPERLNLALRMLQSTSPSYLLLASLDIARRQMALHGREDWERALAMAEDMRNFVRSLNGFELMEQGKAFDYDRSRLVISALELGIDGVELERTLRYRFHIQPEMSDMRSVVLIITPSHTEQNIADLKKVLKEIASAPHGWLSREGAKAPLESAAQLEFPGFPEQLLTPREAYFSACKAVPWEQALGEVCAELITPYPPGIPLICPGERIQREHWDYLRTIGRVGIPIDGLSDPNLEYVKIIDRQQSRN